METLDFLLKHNNFRVLTLLSNCDFDNSTLNIRITLNTRISFLSNSCSEVRQLAADFSYCAKVRWKE